MPELSEMTGVVLWVAGALLVLAGAAKVRRPSGTVSALAEARIGVGGGAVRSLGAVEVATGVAVITVGGIVPALVAAAFYGAFTVFVVRQRRTAGASCGCFGEERAPVGPGHVVVDAVAALAAVSAAVTGAPSPFAVGADAGALVGTLALVALGAWLVRLGLTAGAELHAAVALHPRPAPVAGARSGARG